MVAREPHEVVAMKETLDNQGVRTANETVVGVVAAVRTHQADVLVSSLRDGSSRLHRVVE